MRAQVTVARAPAGEGRSRCSTATSQDWIRASSAPSICMRRSCMGRTISADALSVSSSAQALETMQRPVSRSASIDSPTQPGMPVMAGNSFWPTKAMASSRRWGSPWTLVDRAYMPCPLAAEWLPRSSPFPGPARCPAATPRWADCEPSTDRAPRGLPASPVHDVVEGAAVGVLHRAQRPVGGVAEAEQIGAEVAVGEAEDLARLVLVADRRVPGADAQVGRGDHHERGRLAEVVGDALADLVVGRVLGDQGDGRRRAGDVRAALRPGLGQLDELLAVGDDDEVPRLPVRRGRRPPAGLEDLLELLAGDGLVGVLAHVAACPDGVPCLHTVVLHRVRQYQPFEVSCAQALQGLP